MKFESDMRTLIRWGILGPGKIAHSFAGDLELVETGVLNAVASRSMERATAFAETYDAPYVFDDYDAMLASDTIDVVYIATPHTGHEMWALKAMEQGKHVLCEKPLGINRSQVERMIACAKKNGVFLMEALWTRFNPSIQKIKQLVDAKKIGEIGYLHADFAFYGLDKGEEGRLLNPELAGGSLLDIGIYPIFLSYLLLGKPKNIQSSVNIHHTGAEVQAAMLFDYGNTKALLYSGLTSNSEMRAEIQGTGGTIFIDSRWHETQGFSVIMDGVTKEYGLPTTGKGYSHEINEVHSCLQSGQLESEQWCHANSLDLITLLDTVRQQSNIVFPFEK